MIVVDDIETLAHEDTQALVLLQVIYARTHMFIGAQILVLVLLLVIYAHAHARTHMFIGAQTYAGTRAHKPLPTKILKH